MNELRFALRRLAATPMVTLSAIACLSIGVWMTCVVTAVGRGVFTPDLGVPAAEQLVQVDEPNLYIARENGKRPCCFSGRTVSASVMDEVAASKVFASVGYYMRTGGIVDAAGRGRSVTMVSSGMMDVLGVHLALGRRFVPADDSSAAVIISYGLWQSMFGGDPQVIGRRVRFWRMPSVPIVGVLREGDVVFPKAGYRVDAYVSAGILGKERLFMRSMLGRLRDGTTVDDVAPVIRGIALRHAAADREAFPDWYRSQHYRSTPPELAPLPVSVRVGRYFTEPLGSDMISFISLVIACGLAVVLIAAANVANLLLVRGAARRQEIAVRMALGAGRAQILRGLLLETGLLSVGAIVIGFLGALWQWTLIDSSFDGRDFLGDISGSSLPIAIAAGLILSLVVGAWPGIRATSLSLESVLRDARRTGLAASPLDSVLGRMVAASTAATVMLLVCAVMLGLSARDWVGANIPQQRKAFTTLLTLDDRQSRARRAEVVRSALGQLRGTAGVRVAAVGVAPTDVESITLHATVDGEASRRLASTQVFDVSGGYFDAMRLRLIEGREFTALEGRDSTNAVIVSRSVATSLFGATGSLGRRFRFSSETDSIVHEGTVVGVAEDLPSTGSTRQIYRAFGTLAPARIPAIVTPQLTGPVEAPAITRALRKVPGLISSDVSQLGLRPQSGFRIISYMVMGFTMFAAVGIVLAAIGMYGIVAYSVARRTHEIGVRIALGAQQSKVTWMIVEQGLKTTLTGIVFGLFLSYAGTRVLAAFLTDVRSDFAIAMASVVTLVIVVSGVACWIPGYRAGRLNPVDALRAD